MTAGSDAGLEGGPGALPGRVVFLVGMARSGTTLLLEMLAGHPDIGVTPETHVFRQYCRSPAAASRALDPVQARRLQGVLSAALGIPSPRGDPPGSVGALFRHRFAAAMAASGRAILVEKTPDHGFYTAAIQAVFPEARFILIVRDPRDVALSWQPMPWNPAGLAWPVWRWAAMDRHLADVSRRTPDAVVLVRYEDLLARPETELARVLAFLGLVAPARATGPRTPASYDPAAEPWKARAMETVDPDHVALWRTALTPEQQYLLDRLAGPALARRGYPPSGQTLRTAGILPVLGTALRESGRTAGQAPRSILKYLLRHRPGRRP